MSNNIFYLVRIKYIHDGEKKWHDFAVKTADSMDGAAAVGMLRAKALGFDSPKVQEVQKKALASLQPQLDS